MGACDPPSSPENLFWWSRGPDVRRVVTGQDRVEFSLLAHATLVEPDSTVALAAQEIVTMAREDDDARR